MARAKKTNEHTRSKATVTRRIAETKELLLSKLEQSPIIRVACAQAGVGKDFYYSNRKLDLEFQRRANAALQEGREFVSDLAESQVVKKIRDGDKTMVIFWLKNHRKDLYNDRVIHEHEENPLTPEKIKEIAEAIARWEKTDEEIEEEALAKTSDEESSDEE